MYIHADTEPNAESTSLSLETAKSEPQMMLDDSGTLISNVLLVPESYILVIDLKLLPISHTRYRHSPAS